MKNIRDVDGYISCAPEAVRGTLSELRAAIRTSVPQAEESTSYGMPFYRYKGRLVYFSLWKNHIGVYALSAPILNQYKKELKGSLGSKGTLRFPLDEKLPLSLIKKLVKAQARRNALGQKKRSHRTKAGLWRCPVCGREFAHPNQWHSHAGRPIDAHFQGRPEARLIYDELVKKLNEFGPLRTDAVKTSINLIAKRHLGGVRVQKDGLRVGFLLERKLSDRRILRSEWVGGTRYGHSVKVKSAEELDAQLLGWLKEAYELAS